MSTQRGSLARSCWVLARRVYALMRKGGRGRIESARLAFRAAILHASGDTKGTWLSLLAGDAADRTTDRDGEP